MFEEYREKRFAPPPLPQTDVLAGRLGRKAATGSTSTGRSRRPRPPGASGSPPEASDPSHRIGIELQPGGSKAPSGTRDRAQHAKRVPCWVKASRRRRRAASASAGALGLEGGDHLLRPSRAPRPPGPGASQTAARSRETLDRRGRRGRRPSKPAVPRSGSARLRRRSAAAGRELAFHPAELSGGRAGRRSVW